MKVTLFAWLVALPGLAATPWELLTQGAAEENSIRRAQAIAAVGTIRTAEADKLIQAALKDKESSVRLEAVNALAERRSRAAIPSLKAALNDDAGEVSFTAAKALWEMGDRSGRELLVEVLSGERKQSTGFIKQQMRGAKSTLRNRKALVWMGAKEGAGFLFGPLGTGLGIAEGILRDGSAQARALSAKLLAQDKDSQTAEELADALYDKSPLVRLAAAKALGGFADPALIAKLEPVLDDKNEAVKYMAAASILRIEQKTRKAKAKA